MTFQDYLHRNAKENKFNVLNDVLSHLSLSERLSVLLKRNANRETMVHAAASTGARDVIAVMLNHCSASERRTILHQQNGQGLTPLHQAVENSNRVMVQYMLQETDGANRLELIMLQEMHGHTPLHMAAINQAADIIECLLEHLDPIQKKVAVLLKNVENKTCLHEACGAGKTEIVHCIMRLLNREDWLEVIRSQDRDGRNLIFCAAASDSTSLVQFLLNCTPPMQIIHILAEHDVNGKVLVNEAIKNKQIEIVKVIFNSLYYAQVISLLQSKDKHGETPLHAAIEAESQVFVEFILQGVKPPEQLLLLQEKNNRGWTGLHNAAHAKSCALNWLMAFIPASNRLRLLTVRDLLGNTTLHMAVLAEKEDTVKQLIESVEPFEKKQFVMIKNEHHQSATHLAAAKQLTLCLQLIMDAAEIEDRLQLLTDKDNMTRTPMHYAVVQERPSMISCMLDNLAPSDWLTVLREKHDAGQNALMVAIDKKSLPVVQVLVDHISCLATAEILTIYSECDDNGMTPLHLAIESKSKQIAEILVQAVSDDVRSLLLQNISFKGTSPLHYAALKGAAEILGCFLDCTKQPNDLLALLLHKDRQTRTVLHHAVMDKNVLTVKTLLDSLPHTNWIEPLMVKHDGGQNPFMVAIEKKSIPVVEAILNYVSCMETSHRTKFLNELDNSGKTLFHLAVESDCPGIAQLLVEHMDETEIYQRLTIEDIDGRTALHLAVSKGYQSMLSTILDAVQEPKIRANLLCWCDLRNRTTLHYAVMAKNAAIVQCLLVALDPVDRLRFLKMKHLGHQTPFLVAVELMSSHVLKVMVEQLTPEERLEIILQKDSSGDTALHNAVSVQKGAAEEVLQQLASIKQQLGHFDALAEGGRIGIGEHCGFELLDQLARYSELTENTQNGQLQALHDFLGWLQQLQASTGSITPEMLKQVAHSQLQFHRAGQREDTSAPVSNLELVTILFDALPLAEKIQAVKERNLRGKTPLHIAAEHGQVEIVKYLMNSIHSSDICSALIPVDASGDTVLHLVTRLGYEEMLDCIIPLSNIVPTQCLQILRRQNLQGRTALHLAAKHPQKSAHLLKLMLDRLNPSGKAELLTVTDFKDKTAVHILSKFATEAAISAVFEGLPSAAKLHLLTKRDYKGRTSLEIAMNNPVVQRFMIQSLGQLELNALLKERNESGCNLLHIAANLGKTELLVLILELLNANDRGNVLAEKDHRGQTVWHSAITHLNTSSLKRLLELSGDYRSSLLCLKNDQGHTPTDCTSDKRVQQILDAQASTFADERSALDSLKLHCSEPQPCSPINDDCNATLNQTTVQLISNPRNLKAIKFMIENLDETEKVDLLWKRDWLDRNILHIAAGSSPVLECLLQNTELNSRKTVYLAKDHFGEICFHVAIRNCTSYCIKLLLKGLSDIELQQILKEKDDRGRTVLHYATQSSLAKCGLVLSLLGPQGLEALNDVDKNANTPVVLASARIQKRLLTIKEQYQLYSPPSCILIYMTSGGHAIKQIQTIKDCLIEAGLKISVRRDLNRQSILNVIEEAANREDESALIVMIMAYGENGMIYDCDEQEVNVKDIGATMCTKALHGKPKILILQGCPLREGVRETLHGEADTGLGIINGIAENLMEGEDCSIVNTTSQNDINYATGFTSQLATQLKKCSEDANFLDLICLAESAMEKDGTGMDRVISKQTSLTRRLCLKSVWVDCSSQ